MDGSPLFNQEPKVLMRLSLFGLPLLRDSSARPADRAHVEKGHRTLISSGTVAEAIARHTLRKVRRKVSRVLLWLFVGQWLLACVLAIFAPRFAWGPRETIGHVAAVAVAGAALSAAPVYLLVRYPDAWETRHFVAIAQMLWSGMLLYVTHGRAETHFHIFGSLAFIAMYRDARVLATATAAVLVDHAVRSVLMPGTVFTADPAWWRLAEEAAWVLFEDAVLVLFCLQAVASIREVATREANLRQLNRQVEQTVRARTEELERANQALSKELEARSNVESELRQALKLEAVGRLASGVAHEINTPVQFVSDSVQFARDAITDISTVLKKLEAVRDQVDAGGDASELAVEAAVAAEEVEIDYLKESVPKALDRALEGLNRVAAIVRSMKDFAKPDGREMRPADLTKAIESTLVVARNEYKYVADLETDLAPLPPISCHVGELNQAILNIVLNAAEAVAKKVGGTEQRGKIRVRARANDDAIVIVVEDSGPGIPSDIMDRVFDPFFTTKEPGRGAGQGLTVARAVIVDRHHGELTLESDPSFGTRCHVRLPLISTIVRAQAFGTAA